MAKAKNFGDIDIVLQNDDKTKMKNMFSFDEVFFKKLDNPVPLEKVLIQPNVQDSIEGICSFVNGKNEPAASASVVGTLIDQGKIGIINHNGAVQLIGPGRYIFPNPRAVLVQVVALTQNPIRYETLAIIRVQPGNLGLAVDSGTPILLGEGLHVRNSRTFDFREFKSVNQTYLNHGNIHMVRVAAGQYGLVRENNIPKLLPEGLHITVSPFFSFEGGQNANQPHIAHGVLHILQVPKGKVALITENNLPKLLYEGSHHISSSNFSFSGLCNVTDEVITHGTITRFRVRKGEIGLAWQNNSPAFFDEGIFEKDDANFAFVRCVNAGEKQIQLGSRKIITVFDGEVGVSFLKGKLKVLKPDRHVIESAEHIFHGFLSTQQQCLRLFNEGKSALEYLVCETKDFVEISIKADVFYRIADAEKVLLIVGKDNVTPLVRETAVATLNSIIRSTSLAEVAQNKEINAKSEKKMLEQAAAFGMPSAPMFFDKVHDEFIAKLHDSFNEQFGIDICNIRIESFKILNQELAANISRQALTTTQTETQLSNLAGQTQIAVAEIARTAEVARIKAEGESVRLRTETDARNRATMESAKAEADSTLIRARSSAESLSVKAKAEALAFELKARAEAQAMEVKANAEANAILKKAEAEAKRAEMLAETPLGGQMAMFEMYSQMVRSSMNGVSKIVYLPKDLANNPFSFMAMNQDGTGLPMVPPMIPPNVVLNPKKQQ